MEKVLRIGVIGDFDKDRPSHVATANAIYHAAAALFSPVDIRWIPTLPLENPDNLKCLFALGGIWGAPGDHDSSLGIINAIQVARENNIPYLGT